MTTPTVHLPTELAGSYSSPSQRARVMTQAWLGRNGYCPSCGGELGQYGENKPVADFYCDKCGEDFELKSKSRTINDLVADGEYSKKIERLSSDTHPSLLLLSYEPLEWSVRNLVVVPKQFFTADIIQRRNPLRATARRAGWVGSNILLSGVPETARIHMVRDGVFLPQSQVRRHWKSTLFLRDERVKEARGWLLDIMKCIDTIGKREFTLSEMYDFLLPLACLHPNNKHIKDKIRQQLQVLRDRGYLRFVGAGRYWVTESLDL